MGQAVIEVDVEEKSKPRSHVFLIRLWQEDLGDGKTEWRGRLQHLAPNQIVYFRDWQTLVTQLQEMLTYPSSNPGPAELSSAGPSNAARE